jgi:hypothetical protein
LFNFLPILVLIPYLPTIFLTHSISYLFRPSPHVLPFLPLVPLLTDPITHSICCRFLLCPLRIFENVCHFFVKTILV